MEGRDHRHQQLDIRLREPALATAVPGAELEDPQDGGW